MLVGFYDMSNILAFLEEEGNKAKNKNCGSNGNEGGPCIPHCSSITGASPSD